MPHLNLLFMKPPLFESPFISTIWNYHKRSGMETKDLYMEDVYMKKIKWL